MQSITGFIHNKSPQLAYYVRAYLFHRLTYEEFDIFIWDTLEEWAQVSIIANEPYSLIERVFWHLLHQVKFWSESDLKTDILLRQELMHCVSFLEGKSTAPLDCVGIRP